MGNDLQQWRVAIGCFSPRGSSPEKTRFHSSSKRSSEKSNASSVEGDVRTTPGLRVFPLLLVIVTLLLVIGGVQLNPGPILTKFPFENLQSGEHSASDHPLDSILEKHGLAIVENSGMGDCLFEALSDQLKRLTPAKVNTNDLRQSLLKYIQRHPTLPNDEHVMTLFDSEANTEWQEFVAIQDSTENLHTRQLSWYTNEYMVRSCVWGDTPMLYAFTKLYGIDVAIYSVGTDEPYTMRADDEPGDKKIMQARLGYIPHLHFVSVVNKTDVADGEVGWRIMSDRLGKLFLTLLNSKLMKDRGASLRVEILSQIVDILFEANNNSIRWPDGLVTLLAKLVEHELEQVTGVDSGFLKHSDRQETRAFILNTKESAPNKSSLQKLLQWYEHMSGIYVDDNEEMAHSKIQDDIPLRGSGHACDEISKEQLGEELLSALVKPGIVDNVLGLLRNIRRFLDLPFPPSSVQELDERAQLLNEVVCSSIKNKHDVPDGHIKIVAELASRDLRYSSAFYNILLKKSGALDTRDHFNEKKDAASESHGNILLKLLQEYEHLVGDQYNEGDTPTTLLNDVLPDGGISQLKKLLEICVNNNKATLGKADEKIDYIPEGKESKEVFTTMYDLGKEITACDKETEIEKQATLMCKLGKKYADLAEETADKYANLAKEMVKFGDLAEETAKYADLAGWYFNYATALYNAALQRVKKCFTENEVNLSDRVDSINGHLQQLETKFLKTVSKTNKEPLVKVTERYKSVLKGIREYSNKTIESIHTKDMQVDNETFEMSEESQRRTIKNSKIFYETLTCKIIELHRLMINDCISVLGRPDCKFAILGLGSLARKEVTAWSDLESAVLYDVTGKTKRETEILKHGFRILVHYFHLKIINLGETLINGLDIPVLNDWNSKLPKDVKDNDFWDKITPQGLCFDGTQPKASKIPFGRRSTKNPSKQDRFELIMTLGEMSECQFEEVSLKEGYHLSDVLSTSTLIMGDKSLWEEYNDKVHEILESPSAIDPSMSVGKKRGMETLREDLQNYLSKPLTPESFNKQMRTKHNIYRFATISINILKLLHHSKCFAPLDILNELGEKKVLTDRAKTDLQFMVCAATNMRHLVYGRYDQQHELVSFVSRPAQDELNRAFEYLSVRDYAQVIFRFYETLTPWTDFLLYNFCFNDISKCTHAPQYTDANSKTAKLQENMYMFQDAIDFLERQNGKLIPNNAESKEKLRSIQQNLAKLYLSQGKFNESIEHANESLRIETTPSEENQDTSSTLGTLANAYLQKGEFDESIQCYEKSLATHRTIHGDHPHSNIAAALGNLGSAYNSKGEFDKAIQYHNESLAMERTIHGNHPHPGTASALGDLGSTYDSKGEFDKAIQYHKQSLAMNKTIHGNHPHPGTAYALGNLGSTYDSKGEFAEAIQYHNESLVMNRTIHGNNPHPNIASTLGCLGIAYHSKGEFHKAIRYHNESLTIRRTIHGNHPHPHIANTLMNLGIAYQNKGEFDKAIQYHNESLVMNRTIHGNHPHPSIASALGCLGTAYHSKGDFDKAIQYHNESHAMKRTIHGNHPHPDIASTFMNLGITYLIKGELDKAIQYHNESLAMKRKIHGNHPHPDIASSLESLGNAYYKKGDQIQALQYYTQCLIIRKQIYGYQPHPDIASLLHNISLVYVHTHKYADALKHFYEARDMLKKIHGDNPHPDIHDTLHVINVTEQRLTRRIFIMFSSMYM